MTMTTKATQATLSPSVHEAAIKRHFSQSEENDPILLALCDGVRLAREMASKAAQTTAPVLRNTLETEASRHKKARAAGFALMENASAALDEAIKAAEGEVAVIQLRTSGPPPSKDVIGENRQRELRERLSLLPKQRRMEIINKAVSDGDDLLIGAVLSQPAWVTGSDMTETDVALVRHNWARRRYASDLDRLDRIQRAIVDAMRAGQQANGFVDSLTDADLIAAADETAKAATDALQAAKG
jgi:hypothetical protein